MVACLDLTDTSLDRYLLRRYSPSLGFQSCRRIDFYNISFLDIYPPEYSKIQLFHLPDYHYSIMAPFKVGSVDVKMRDASRPQAPPATPSSTTLPAGHKKRPDCRALMSPIIFDKHQILTLRDGTKIRADIFRPVGDETVPAIVMWGPYGKSGTGLLNLHSAPLRAGIPANRLSGYEDFEGCVSTV